MPFDGDVVVVVDPAEIAEAEVASERRRFVGDALHQTSITADGEGGEVEEFESWSVVSRCRPTRGHRHADAGRDALAEWARGGLDAAGPSILWMAGTFRVHLPKTLDVVDRDRRIAGGLVLRIHRFDTGKMENRIEEHRRMSVAEDKAIAVGPNWIRRVIVQSVLPEGVGNRRECHGRTRMTAIRRLHRVHGEGSNGVDGKRINIRHITGRTGKRSIGTRRGHSWFSYPNSIRFQRLLAGALLFCNGTGAAIKAPTRRNCGPARAIGR